jgi:hypothetical protein
VRAFEYGPPNLPAAASARAAPGSITVRWRGATGNGAPITGYRVDLLRYDPATFRSSRAGRHTVAADAVKTTTFTGTVAGGAYYAEVFAKSRAGEGGSRVTNWVTAR